MPLIQTLYNQNKFPYPSENDRLYQYDYLSLLLESEHFRAFSISGSDNFNRAYSKLRYVVSNFVGLVAKVSADMLFGEEIQIKMPDGNNQEWIENLIFFNNLQTQFFESAITNAAIGDALLKIRTEDEEIIIEDTNPTHYFPHINKTNVRAKPKRQEISTVYKVGDDEDTQYLIREVHVPGYIFTEIRNLIKVEKGIRKIGAEVSMKTFNKVYGTNYVNEVETGVNYVLLSHIPNYRLRGNANFFGTTDFSDLVELQFALNNRMTKADNILDKHSDPILAVPEGVLDEDGQARKEAFHMIELGDGGEKPEYIVWNANLDAAFQQIDKLVEFLFMFSETSPDVLGIGKGQAETGRALKMRLLRTLAKRNRKQRYYDQAIKEVLYIAQILSKQKGYKINGEVAPDEPVIPQIIWADGIVDDPVEKAQVESVRIESGTRSKKKSIMVQDKVSEEEADEELAKVNKERANFTSIYDNRRNDNGDE